MGGVEYVGASAPVKYHDFQCVSAYQRHRISLLFAGTCSEGEFGWGGTPAKLQRRCPKASSVRMETSRRLKGEKLALLVR